MKHFVKFRLALAAALLGRTAAMAVVVRVNGEIIAVTFTSSVWHAASVSAATELYGTKDPDMNPDKQPSDTLAA